ncbi:hypothetical protein [Limosilactobacillus reuteri]|uniref:hypothetical protein n=1 Tax=Limosilactobacillus reuteri TaxID=1598 RepID=UPI001E3D1337|nr:hypothetical protein [Limosilactobacillus reuteri]MCC4466435.1 hypothetical protein [Limosilactobacillus reuteri]MCC4474211.1 hypothetical protein [Limosilactobacillus reuteri]
MRKRLSELLDKRETFTVKRDFDMTGFLLKSKPDHSFSISRDGENDYTRTNTFSNVNLSGNLILSEEDIVKLIEEGKTVVVFYELEKRLDAYNFKDSMELLSWVVAS